MSSDTVGDGKKPSSYQPGDDDAGEVVLDLARQFTNLSQRSLQSEKSYSDINPFLDFSNPLLNPNSPDFNARAWTKHLVSLEARNADSHPLRKAGVSFKNLSVYGHGASYDYQKTVLNLLPSMIQQLMTLGKKKTRIDILHNLNGVVKPGETCVVLGRPGRYEIP